MASIRTLKATNTLFIDFRYNGKRCREYTKLEDTAANRKKLQRVVQRLEAELEAGSFDYDTFFAGSRKAEKGNRAASAAVSVPTQQGNVVAAPVTLPTVPSTPNFAEFARTWMTENEVLWRRTYKRTVEDIVNKYFLPVYAERAVASFSRAEILQFRAELAKVPGRKKETLSPRRINAVMNILSLILREASDRYQFTCPYYNIKPLRIPKSEVKARRPYQTRHTAATLWLAAGENPEWIARQMGHTSTEMLFKVYSRYVPNLTRQDGSAFERLLERSLGEASVQGAEPESKQEAPVAEPDEPSDPDVKEQCDE